MLGRKYPLAALLGATLMLFGGTVQAQGQGMVPYQEGLHYFKIDNAKAIPGDTVEVMEFFSYLCSHCNTFEPYVNSWAERIPEYVDFKRIPGISSPWVMGHVRAGEEQVIAEITAAGFALTERLDFMQTQFYLRFRRQ